jgi:hypothetical protein
VCREFALCESSSGSVSSSTSSWVKTDVILSREPLLIQATHEVSQSIPGKSFSVL